MTAGFTAPSRHLLDEETIQLVSVGVDIGSSTTHLAFSRLDLERRDNRYEVVSRTVLHESDILLTPYRDQVTIDAEALEQFVEGAYAEAGLLREQVDTGALILTGVALRRANARAVADLFAAEAGRFVSVSAGDRLEALLAAHGSGALARSGVERRRVLNVDIGGGTTKLVACSNGQPTWVAAVEIGARLVAWDADDRVVRLEETGRRLAEAAGLDVSVGSVLSRDERRRLARYMADRLVSFILGAPLAPEDEALLRTPIPAAAEPPEVVTFSGGVAEFVYGRETREFGDLGPLLAREIRSRVQDAGIEVLEPEAGIRATVIGASQYTLQVSGSTIFVEPPSVLPVRNVPVVAPVLDLEQPMLDSGAIARSVAAALELREQHGQTPVALSLRWGGSATFGRLDALCRGLVDGLAVVLHRGHPVVLAFEGDVGGLIGLHLKETLGLANPVISIDGVQLGGFDYVDIGEVIPSSGAVPVVVKSLVFSNNGSAGSAALQPAGSGAFSSHEEGVYPA